jgi:hypothetical protein
LKKGGIGPDRPPGRSRNHEVDVKGEAHGNGTHESATDPECRLYKRGELAECKLHYMAHALLESHNGLVVDIETTQANVRAEWEAA